MSLVVAFYVPHNEGTVSGLITGPDFNSGTKLVDLYEVDATIESFSSESQAKQWLAAQHGGDMPTLLQVDGGHIAQTNY